MSFRFSVPGDRIQSQQRVGAQRNVNHAGVAAQQRRNAVAEPLVRGEIGPRGEQGIQGEQGPIGLKGENSKPPRSLYSMNVCIKEGSGLGAVLLEKWAGVDSIGFCIDSKSSGSISLVDIAGDNVANVEFSGSDVLQEITIAKEQISTIDEQPLKVQITTDDTVTLYLVRVNY